MNAENQNEIWQVEVGGQVYEAPLLELPEWIEEGSLQPEDKIRKGNLRWIEARKVPALVPFFNARAKGETIPLIKTVTEQGTPESHKAVSSTVFSTPAEVAMAKTTGPEVSAKGQRPASPEECVNHSGVLTAWICSQCNASLCKACPRSYGGNVRICPECGAMCRSSQEIAETTKKATIASRVSTEGFGMSDFFAALAYPFKFKSSLFFGGLMFMFFTIGQSASGIGGIFMIGASIICMMLSNMLTFGVLANTVTNFTQGNLEADFMPSFEDFSLWDDVVHPFFLSIGAYLASFGPFFLVAAIGGYMLFNNLSAQSDKFKEQVSKIPGTELYAPDRTVEQSQQVKDLLAKVKQRNDSLLKQKEGEVAAAESTASTESAESAAPAAPGQVPAYSADKEAVDLEKSLRDMRAKQIEAATGGIEPEASYREMALGILKIAAPVVVIGLLALLWGFLYFPAACCVAGYSRSFTATINPLVGLDTIKRLGGTYVKIVLISLLLGIAAAIVQTVLASVLSPFAMPRVGNVPATAVGSFVSFYMWVVFFCMLGYALFKSSDRLKLHK